MQNKNEMIITRSNPEVLRFLRDIVVFRLVSYLWNMICFILQLFTKLHISELLYKFDTALYQFLETETSDRCLICILYTPEILRFNPIPPFIFPSRSL